MNYIINIFLLTKESADIVSAAFVNENFLIDSIITESGKDIKKSSL